LEQGGRGRCALDVDVCCIQMFEVHPAQADSLRRKLCPRQDATVEHQLHSSLPRDAPSYNMRLLQVNLHTGATYDLEC
jgi:hypothetical protein